MVYNLLFFFFKIHFFFHNSKVFGFCIIHILYTGCAKIKKKSNSGAKSLIMTEKTASALCRLMSYALRRFV